MRRITKTFAISQEMVDDFAALTGDRNALHVDAEIARRFRHRRPVVHGMLPVSFLVCLQEACPGSLVTFVTLEARFLAPVFIGVGIHLEVSAAAEQNGILPFDAHWTREADGGSLIKASGTVRVESPPSHPPAARDAAAPEFAACLLTEQISEGVHLVDELNAKSERFQFSLDPGVLSRFQTLLFRPALGRDDYDFCPNLAASLLLSTLVGMRLPGRYATFGSFAASFDKVLSLGTPCSLSGSVEKVSKAGESISVSASFVDAGETAGSAQLKVLVNPPPRAMIDCEAIKARYVETGVRGKVAVITGSSRGIGETTAKLFAMHGAKTVVHYHQGRRDAEAIVAEITRAGGTAMALGCDIRDEAQVTRFFADVVQAHGRVDVLVNNAVKEFSPKSVLQLRWEDYLEELEVSLKGLHNCCCAAIPIFTRQGGGKIVNLSSVIVDNPVSGQNRYITAKSAVVGYTRSLAKEFASDNIQVNLVVPATTETDLLSSIPAELVRRMGAEREYGRNLAPIEVALSILYLSSGWSDGITGQQIVLNLGEPPFA